MGDEGIDQCACFIAGAWMDDQPRRFVYDDQILVFIEYLKRDILSSGQGCRSGWNDHFNMLAAPQLVTSAGYDHSLDTHAAFRDKVLEPGAAKCREGFG